jgi:spermidine/putrescine ABC transporter ATP-binding subunit
MRLTRPDHRGARAGANAPADVVIDKISVAYGDTRPVDDLSLTVQAGEFLSLLGPSGCGKTTTLRAVAGFVTPQAGDIRIGGKSVSNIPANRRNIGMVYQDYALFPHMTVTENIAFGMKMRSFSRTEIEARIPRLLSQLQLPGFANRYPSQLSGGQKQRVALARALVFEPSVLLLDEPLAALDRQLRGDMQFELRELQRKVGITTIFVTHDQEEALSLSDRVAVLSNGKILQVDTPRGVYAAPAHRIVAEFIGVANFLPGTVVGRGGNESLFEVAGIDSPLRLNGRHGDGAATLLLRPENIRLHEPRSLDRAPCNAMTGNVLNSVYVGTGIKYQVRLASGLIMRIDVPLARQEAAAIDSEVIVEWDPADAQLYRDDRLEV